MLLVTYSTSCGPTTRMKETERIQKCVECGVVTPSSSGIFVKVEHIAEGTGERNVLWNNEWKAVKTR